ncbi:MAG: ABC transporter permease [Syntrophaceae bacterium]|nr:ABC transporter permease [Syntrophaceae bacterium]
MNRRRIQAVARKEFYHLIRDFRSLYLAFAIPLLLILLFGYALSLDVDRVATVVVDHDRTDLSRDIIRRLDASSYFTVQTTLPDTKTAGKNLDRGDAALAVIIPAGFTAGLRHNRETAIQLLLDGSDPNFSGMVRSYVTAFFDRYNQERLRDFLNHQGKTPLEQPVEGRIRIWFNEDLESRNFIIPGIIAVIIMIVGAMLTSLVIAREYENGTMETIRSLPLTAGELLLGKAIPYFLIGLTDVLIAVLMAQVLFDVVMKSSFWLMMAASSLYLAVALVLGLLISILTKSQLVANQIALLATYLPSLLLSNFVFPVSNMPVALQVLTRFVPATYYIDILNGIFLKHLTLIQMGFSFLILAIMFITLLGINWHQLRKEGL